MLLAGYMRPEEQQEDNSDFECESESSEQDQTTGQKLKEMILQGASFPDYEPILYERKNLGDQVFTSLFIVEPYGDIPYNEASDRMMEEAVTSMRTQAEGKNVAFGSEITLKHYVSGMKLRASDKTGEVFGARKLTMSSQVDNPNVITIRPASKYVPQNSDIPHDAQVILSFERMPTASNLMLIAHSDEESAYLGTQASSIKMMYFNPKEVSKFVKVSVPCHIQAKGQGFFLGASETSAQYVDVKDSSTVWAILHEDSVKGGYVDLEGRYVLFNIQSGLFIGPDLQLVDLEKAIKFSLQPVLRGEKRVSFSEEIRIASDSNMLGVKADTNHSICLRSMYPKTTKSETPDIFTLSLGSAELLHQLHTYVVLPLEDSATKLLLLNDLRSSVKYWTNDVNDYFNEMFEDEDGIDGYDYSIEGDFELIENMMKMIQQQHMNGSYQEKGLITKLMVPTELLKAVFAFLDMKKITKQHINTEKDADNKATLQRILKKWKVTYASLCETLIQILKTDTKACFQIKKEAEAKLNRVSEDSDFLPIVVKLSQLGGVADMPQDEVVKGFTMWLGTLARVTPKNVVKQNVVASSLSSFIRELSAGFMGQFVDEMRKVDLPLRKYTFLKHGNSIYVNFLPETAFKGPAPSKIESNSETFLALDNLTDDNFSEFTATLLSFYESCWQAFDSAINQELFNEVGISHDVIVTLVNSEASPLLVRSEALRVLASFIPPVKRETSLKRTMVLFANEARNFEQVFKNMKEDQTLSENAAILKKCFTHSTFTSEDSLLERIKFATSVFSFAKALVASDTVMVVEIVQRYAISALAGWNFASQTAPGEALKGNWVYLCIKDARKEQKAELTAQLNLLLEVVFSTLKCALDVKEDLLLRQIVGKCIDTNWTLTESDAYDLCYRTEKVIDSGLFSTPILPRDYTEAELNSLPTVREMALSVFSAQSVALDMSFPLTEDTYDLLLRVCNPLARVKARLSEVLLVVGPCRELEGLTAVGTTEAVEVAMAESIKTLSGEGLVEAVRQQISLLSTKLQLLQDPSICKFAQSVALREEAFKPYLTQWEKIQQRLRTPLAAEEKLALLQLACSIFRYCTLLVTDNPEAKEVVLRHLSHPLSDFEKSDLELVDLGHLIRELNDFTLVRVVTARTFFSYLHAKYYKKSIEATGAYEWFPAVLVNHDGTIKRDLQVAAYMEIRESLAKEEPMDQTGAYPMLVKQATLCAVGNKEVCAQVALELPADKLLAFLNASQAPNIAEAVALVLGRVHAPILVDKKQKGDPDMLQALQKVLEIAKSVLGKEEEVAAVVQAGLYEQVRSKVSANTRGWFLTPEQFAVVSLLRLVSSGSKPEPLGGVANSAMALLKAYNGENLELRNKLTTDYTEFFKLCQAFIAKLKQRLADSCDFTAVEQALGSVLADSATKKAPKAVEGSLILKGLGKAVVPGVKAESFFLTPKLQALLTASLSSLGSDKQLFDGLKEIFNFLMTTVSLNGGDVVKNEQRFIHIFKLISDLMVHQPSKKYIFKALKVFTTGFSDVTWSKHAYATVLKFWVTQMIATKDLTELLDGVDFYLNFGSHMDTVRYDQLLELLGSDQGPRLFAKIKKALAIELLIRKHALKASAADKSVTHLIRKIRPGRFVTGADFRNVIELHSELVVAYIQLLKAMCDNCNRRMQRFIREQGTDNDVNLVAEVLGFCSNILDMTLKTASFAENRALVLTAMDAVADFCTGPAMNNQVIVGKDIKLFLGVNAVFRLKYEKDFSKDLDLYVDLRKGTLHLLQVLLEGNPSADILQTFQTFLGTDIMVAYVTNVYKAIIAPNRKVIELGDFGSDRRHPIVEYAMDTSLFLVQYLNLSGIGLKEMLKTEDSVTAFREYYLQYCGYVELFKPSPFSSSLDNPDNIWGVNFRIPFKCKLLTNDSANALIVQVSHASHQEQLTDFMNQVAPLAEEMDHQLDIYHSCVLKFMTSHWALYKDLSLYLVLLINLYVLIAFDNVRDFNPLDPWEVSVVLVGGIIQATLYFLGWAFHIVQRYPLILHAYSNTEPEEMEMDQFYGLPDHDSQKYKHFQETCTPVTRTPNGCLAMLCYLPTFTGLLYMTASILSILYPLLSPVLLLTIIERKVEVQNVLKAVTQNKKQLALSGLLGVIIMYVFSVFAFLYFASFYENGENLNCSTVLECLLTTINMGLRGGLSDAMGNPETKDVYWMRYTFDILFHLIIIILLMSVLFGIIIDTFGKLRDERTDLYDKINNSCYVCDQTRNRIELGGKGWSYHFQVEHSPFAYLAYLVRLKDIPEQERNGIESYVYKLFTESDSSFFPSTSRHLIQALN